MAYQTSAYLAIEEACGVTVDGPIADLRRLLYNGEWIESHSLHIYLLHAPIFWVTAAGSRWPPSGATSWSAAWE